jgi:NAD(P)H-dependent FMN reductase
MAGRHTALIVNASPHKPSVTSRFCDVFAEGFGAGYTTWLDLHAQPPPHSDGTYERDGTPWQQAVLATDVLFVATPTYWFNIPSILKAFLDDLTAIEEQLWEAERFAVIAVHAPQGGEIGALNALLAPLNMMGFTLPGNGYVYYRHEADDWAWTDLKEIAKRMRFA